jgi:hypothetical protein
VHLWSRNEEDLGATHPSIAKALVNLPASRAALVYYIFDVMVIVP